MSGAPTGTVLGTNLVYDLLTGLKQDVSELITLISPTETPLLTGTNYSGLPGLLIQNGEPATQKKVEWNEYDLLLPSVTFTATTINSGAGTVNVGAEHQRKFKVGDIIRVSNTGEYIRVTAYNSTTSLDISRGYGGSTAASITQNTSILVAVGSALAEGSAPGSSRVSDRAMPYNFTQIFGPDKLSMSRTAQKVARWGVSDEFAFQLMNRMKEYAIGLEQAILFGLRYDDTGNKWRTMGGIDYFVNASGVIDNSATSLTATAIQTVQQTCWGRGALPTHLLAGPAQIKALTDVDNTSIVTVDRDDALRGRQRVSVVQTEYGDLEVIRSRYTGTRAYMISPARIKHRILDDMQLTPLAKTSDADEVMWVAERSLEYRNAYADAVFTALT